MRYVPYCGGKYHGGDIVHKTGQKTIENSWNGGIEGRVWGEVCCEGGVGDQ